MNQLMRVIQFENIFLKVTGGSYESFCERIEANKLLDMEENNMFAAYSTEEEIIFQCKEFIIHPSQLLPTRLKLLSCRSSEKIVVVSCEIKHTNTTPYKKVSESVIKYELNGDLYFDYTKNYYSILICYFF